MHRYTTSTNIERDVKNDIHYITTPNALDVYQRLIQGYKSGHHSFNIIGSYGTGKSSFLWALEKNLQNDKAYFAPLNGQFNGIKQFDFFKIIGEANSLTEVLREKLNLKSTASDDVLFKEIVARSKKLKNEGKILIFLIDEFGKFLEYAARNNPEKELYFIQKLAETANDPERNVILITTLHQNFGAYAKGLDRAQKKEWEKVKGRLIDISFDEPVEQLLFLASERIQEHGISVSSKKNFDLLFKDINESKLISNAENLDADLARKLYPLDYLSANVLTQALQRYGQNERSLFTFLSSNDQSALVNFKSSENETYHVAKVFDYLTKNLTSELEDKDSNPHKPQWRAILTALEKADALNPDDFEDIANIIKCIGLINLFSKPLGRLDRHFLDTYAQLALNIKDPDRLIDKLIEQRIIKFFNHKNKYFFIDGTDVDIEQELIEASSKISPSIDLSERINYYLDPPVVFAKGIYYQKGIPRFFRFNITEEIDVLEPQGETDGYINLIINDTIDKKEIQKVSLETKAQVFVLLADTDSINKTLFEIEKIDYIIKKYPDDKAAKKLLLEERKHEINKLDEILEAGLYGSNENVAWFYQGKNVSVNSKATLNKLLSQAAKEAYVLAPAYNNEMVNKEYLSSPILTARKNLLRDLLDHAENENLSYDAKKFPPQKTIYLSLLKETGIHKFENGSYFLTKPDDESFWPLWDHCVQFLEDSKTVKKNISVLYDSLARPPFKLKKGFIDFWIPIFLIVKDQDYALFHKEEGYIPYLTSEVLDLLHKKPSNYYVKAYQVDGVKLNLFHKYKEITGLEADNRKTASSLIAIFSRFIAFYRNLPEYAQKSNRMSPAAKGVRDAIAKAKDPETALLDELPKGLGYKNLNLQEGGNNELEGFIKHLNEAIYEIRTSYDHLLDRYEKLLLSTLGIKETEFASYKPKIQSRFKELKPHLLLAKEKTLVNRIMSKLDDRDSWLKSLADVILGKPLQKILDDEEVLLSDNTIKMLEGLESLVELHQLKEERKEEDIIQLQLTEVSGEKRIENIIIKPETETELSELEEQLSELIKKNKNLGKAALVRLLKKL